MHRRLYPACLTMLALALTSACSNSDNPEAQAPKYAAEIRRTEFGIPHIKADDEGGLGFGVGYAYAQDNFCLLADQITTVNGQRSKHFGPDARSQVPI